MAPRSPGPTTADDDAIDVDAEVEALYVDELDGFTAARDTLAKRLRAAGRKDEAAAVKSLRRPTVAAWAVNRVARDHADDIRRLRDVGAELRRAQAQALRRRHGDDTADRLRSLGATRRKLIAELADAASAVISAARDGAGAGADAHRGDIVATFEAVAADDEAAAEVAAGRLARPLEPPVGFGAPAGDDDAEILVLDDDGPRRSTSKGRPTAGSTSAGGTTGRGTKRNADQGGAVHVLDAAEVRKARARAAKAREAVEAAEHEVARLESALTVARQELSRAREASARADAAAGSADATAKRSGS